MDNLLGQRINIKFLMKLEKDGTKNHPFSNG